MRASFRKSILSWEKILESMVICEGVYDKKALLHRLVQLENSCILSFVNAHAANLAWTNAVFADSITSSDIVVRDGIGMRILLDLLGRPSGENLNGTDFIPELLDLIPRDRSLAIYGTQDPYLSAGVGHLRNMGFKTVYAEHGFHAPDYYVASFIERSPSVVVLAMGMPKQESIATLLKRASVEKQLPALIINGGAIVDFMANRFPRSPLWMQQRGLEWLYRLYIEPKRMFRRYVVGNVLFLSRALALYAVKKTS